MTPSKAALYRASIAALQASKQPTSSMTFRLTMPTADAIRLLQSLLAGDQITVNGKAYGQR